MLKPLDLSMKVIMLETYGDISTFSFYGNKTICTGEGGMVVTNNEALFDRSVHFKGQGLAKYRQYWHDVVGYNYRMTNICAAIGLAQLENISTILKRKKRIAEVYKECFSKSEITFHSEADNVVHSYWMCSILIPRAEDRDDLRAFLDKNGIETRPLFYPIHTMPMYSKKFTSHEVAEKISRRGINLPSYPELEEEDVRVISKKILEYFHI